MILPHFHIPDSIGLIGVVVTLLAYSALQLHVIEAHGATYSLMNGIGSLMILYSLWYDWNAPAFVMETVWVAMSAYGFLRALLERPHT